MVKLLRRCGSLALAPILMLSLSALPGTADQLRLENVAISLTEAESTASTITELRDEIQLLRAEQRRLDEEMAPYKDQVQGVLTEKTLTDQQIILYHQEVMCYDKLLMVYDDMVADAEEAYSALKTEADDLYQLLAVRLRQSYEEGMPGLLELMSASEDFISFLAALERQKEIEAYDRSLMAELEVMQGELGKLRVQLDRILSDRHQVAREQVERQQLLNAKIQQSGSYLQTLENSVDRFSYYIQQSQAGVQLADRQIRTKVNAFLEALESAGKESLAREKEQRLALLSDTLKGRMEDGLLQQGKEFYPGGAEYIWPLQLNAEQNAAIAAKMGYITYQVGTKAITGYHSGVDLSANYGTAVVAAASGKVITTGWQEGYGYYVVLWHENGSETRYAHLSQITAKEGDYLLQGEVIGSAGSTGNSTGVGCHFEIYVQGALKDPVDYLKLPTNPAIEGSSQAAS